MSEGAEAKSAKESTLLEATVLLRQAVRRLRGSIYGESPEKTEKVAQPMEPSKIEEARMRVLEAANEISNCIKDLEKIG